MIGSIVFFRGKGLPGNLSLLWAVLGGLAGIVAMILLYRGMAVGNMSIIAPISATGVIMPVIVGTLLGDKLTPLQTMGIMAGILGTILAAMEKDDKAGVRRKADGVGLAIGAAFAVGIFFIVMDRASEADPFWAALIMRVSYGLFLLPIMLTLRPSFKVSRSHYPAIITLGTVDALAGFCFALATTIGMLSVVAVIGALYPVVTIALSVVFLSERPQKIQTLGVVPWRWPEW